jgi:hypothetical protein
MDILFLIRRLERQWLASPAVPAAGGDAEMVHVAPADDRRTRPRSGLTGHVDEDDERGAGAQLEHSVFGQAAGDGAANHVTIEGADGGQVIDREDDMIEALEGEGRRRPTGHGLLIRPATATKKGGRSLPFPSVSASPVTA